MSLKPGVYLDINNKWLPAITKQVEAFNDIKEKFKGTMFSMGMDPTYGTLVGYSNDKTLSYECKIHLRDKIFYLQLGDGDFHEILDIHIPQGKKNEDFFK
jgi:hypothetical protein